MGQNQSRTHPHTTAVARGAQRVTDARHPKDKSGKAIVGGPTMGYVLSPVQRARVITDDYDIPDVETGRGHYGVVRIGRLKTDMSKRFAIKSVPKRRAVYVTMLRQEIQTLKQLKHVNIVQLFDAYEDEKDCHLVFELCTGGELFDPIANRQFRFSEPDASRLIRKLLLAVKHCHDSGVVHRDLKPENLLLQDAGIDSELKLIDFGLATPVGPTEVLKKHVGTPYYIAPEVLEKRYHKECDMWSIGVITFTLMCGFPPFWGDTEKEIYARVRRGFYAFEGPDWASRSAASKDFVSQLLTKNTATRMTVDQALSHPWIVHEGQPQLHPYSRKLFLKLRRFAGFSALKRLALVVLARSLKPQEVSMQLDWYRNFDRLEHGYLTKDALSAAAHDRDIHVTPAEIDFVLDRVGVLRHGVVTYSEFVAATTPRPVYLQDDRMPHLFDMLDVDGDGEISVEDVRAVVGSLGTEDTYAEEIVTDADLYEDGTVSYATFLAVMAGGEQEHM